MSEKGLGGLKRRTFLSLVEACSGWSGEERVVLERWLEGCSSE